nr:hypothetical protein [uncultured Capnocytophaga sp.]
MTAYISLSITYPPLAQACSLCLIKLPVRLVPCLNKTACTARTLC